MQANVSCLENPVQGVSFLKRKTYHKWKVSFLWSHDFNVPLTMSRSKPRSPVPPSRISSSRPFFPPSHYAAAAGLPYNSGLRPSTNAKHSDLNYPLHQQPRPSASNSSSENKVFTSAGNNSTSAPSSTSRQKRQSDLGSIPLLETHLLPSLKDTIDRMTKPPIRSRADMATPPIAFELPRATSRPPSAAFSSPSPSSTNSSALRSSTPLPSAHRKSLPVPTSPRPSIPKYADACAPKPKTKSTLKSALKPATPKLNPQYPEARSTPPSPSPGMSLRSTRSIIDTSREPVPTTPRIKFPSSKEVCLCIFSL